MGTISKEIFSEYCKKTKIDEKLINHYIKISGKKNKQDTDEIKEEIE